MATIRSTMLIALAAVLASACTRAGEGMPTADTDDPVSPTAPVFAPTGAVGHPDFGVLPTVGPAPTGEVTCAPQVRPAVGMVAQVADSVAPVLTIAVPEGWSMQGGTGDVGAQLTGPLDMSATVTIAPTTLDPQQAFADYADELTGDAAVSSLNVLPAPLCDYSGQKLTGALSDTPEEAIEFVDRVVHIPTANRNYLVSIHTQAPTGTRELEVPAQQLTTAVEVRIP